MFGVVSLMLNRCYKSVVQWACQMWRNFFGEYRNYENIFDFSGSNIDSNFLQKIINSSKTLWYHPWMSSTTCWARRTCQRSSSTSAGISGGGGRTRWVKNIKKISSFVPQVAAQNWRKKKIEQIDELQELLDEAKRRQYHLQENHEK